MEQFAGLFKCVTTVCRVYRDLTCFLEDISQHRNLEQIALHNASWQFGEDQGQENSISDIGVIDGDDLRPCREGFKTFHFIFESEYALIGFRNGHPNCVSQIPSYSGSVDNLSVYCPTGKENGNGNHNKPDIYGSMCPKCSYPTGDYTCCAASQ